MKKVLIVDDDPDISEAIQLILEDAGYSSEIVNDGKQVFQKVNEYKPDLIFLDILLSGKDGRIICRDLKNQNSSKHIPIIMISAHPGTRETVKECGADDFLEKPFRMAGLLKKVGKYI